MLKRFKKQPKRAAEQENGEPGSESGEMKVKKVRQTRIIDAGEEAKKIEEQCIQQWKVVAKNICSSLVQRIYLGHLLIVLKEVQKIAPILRWQRILNFLNSFLNIFFFIRILNIDNLIILGLVIYIIHNNLNLYHISFTKYLL